MYECKIIADSINENKRRITTFEVTYPRSIHAEIMTHRNFSRNSASSRAIPVERMIELVKTDPYIPVFTKNQAGMQGIDATDDREFQIKMTELWLYARDGAVNCLKRMSKLGGHKQDINRLIEPFLWHTVIITSTSWANFFALRTDAAAHPAIQTIATMMADAMDDSVPKSLKNGEWHLPYITEDDRAMAQEYLGVNKSFTDGYNFLFYQMSLLCQMSAARCARVSYMRQTSLKSIDEDIERFKSLAGGEIKHASPLEHQAQAYHSFGRSGNFSGGWVQFRKTLPGENIQKFKRGSLEINEEGM